MARSEPTEEEQEYELITQEEFAKRPREEKTSNEWPGDTDEGSFAHAPRKRLPWTEVDERRSIDCETSEWFSQEDTADIFKKPATFFHCRSTVGDCVDGVDAARLVRAAR